MTFGTFPFLRKANKLIRPREFLTEPEVLSLLKACKETRYALRNQALIWTTYAHALRPSEGCNLQWGQIMFDSSQIAIPRLKNGRDCLHPLWDREIRLLKKLKKERNGNSQYCFLTERGDVMSVKAFQNLLEKVGKIAGIPFKAHPHMLRHSLPTKLSNEGVNTATLQAFVGHVSIGNTARYIHQASGAFQGFFRN
jgi:integrase